MFLRQKSSSQETKPTTGIYGCVLRDHGKGGVDDGIPFILYRRPDGLEIPVFIVRSYNTWRKAQEILEAGYHFEMMPLSDDMVHISITSGNGKKFCDVAREIVKNGPGIGTVIDRMIGQFECQKEKFTT